MNTTPSSSNEPDSSGTGSEGENSLASRFPTAYTILFLLIIVVAAWNSRAGYDRCRL